MCKQPPILLAAIVSIATITTTARAQSAEDEPGAVEDAGEPVAIGGQASVASNGEAGDQPWWQRGADADQRAAREMEGDAPPAAPASQGEEAGGPVDPATTPQADAPVPEAVDGDASAFPRFAPYATIVGGFHFEDIQNRDEADTRQDRVTTVALTRIGFQGFISDNVSVLSEIELNAGPHGTSVWEGQAAIQVRNQLLRIDYEGLRIDAGRITDPSSVDYFSTYVANMLLTDPLARFPLLVSGFNRGNGVLVQYSPIEGLTGGFTVNAGNPTSTTGTVMVGGTFPPFSRFYEVPHAHVGRDARGFPADSFHVMLLSPHVMYETPWLRAKASLQWFTVDTNTNDIGDENITGMNLRVGAQLRLLDDTLRPFLNLSSITNDLVDPMATDTLLNEDYEAQTVTGGVDYAIHEESGIGIQYARVRERQGESTVIIRHYANVGGTWWIFPGLALDARAAIYRRCDDDVCTADGQQSYWLTLRGVLGAVEDTSQRRP